MNDSLKQSEHKNGGINVEIFSSQHTTMSPVPFSCTEAGNCHLMKPVWQKCIVAVLVLSFLD